MANHLFIRNLNRCGQEISVLLRSLDGSDYTSPQPVETFTEIATPTAIVKTISRSFGAGGKLFDSVSIDPNATHIFCVIHTSTLADVEFQNYFISLKAENYKILNATNLDEKDEILVFQAVKRGDDTLEATEA